MASKPMTRPAGRKRSRYRVIDNDLAGAFTFAVQLLWLHLLLSESERKAIIKRLGKWAAKNGYSVMERT